MIIQDSTIVVLTGEQLREFAAEIIEATVGASRKSRQGSTGAAICLRHSRHCGLVQRIAPHGPKVQEYLPGSGR